MTDNEHKASVLHFSRTFVNVVNYILFPESDTALDIDDLGIALLKPLKTFLGRHKMELYFLYREELAHFRKELDEKTFKELLEWMISDLKADDYNHEMFSYFCVVLSYFAAIARRDNIPSAHEVAVGVLFDSIEYFEKDNCYSNDIIEGVKKSLMETADKIVGQVSYDETIEEKE